MVGLSSGERGSIRSSGANTATYGRGAPSTGVQSMKNRKTRKVTIDVKVDVAAIARAVVVLVALLTV